MLHTLLWIEVVYLTVVHKVVCAWRIRQEAHLRRQPKVFLGAVLSRRQANVVRDEGDRLRAAERKGRNEELGDGKHKAGFGGYHGALQAKLQALTSKCGVGLELHNQE